MRLGDYFRDFDNLKSELEKESNVSRTRVRFQPFQGSGLLTDELIDLSPPPTPNTSSVSTTNTSWKPAGLQGKQVTVSDYHPSWRLHLGSRNDIGGPFHSLRQYAEIPGVDTRVQDQVPRGYEAAEVKLSTYRTRYVKYRGPILADSMSGFTFPPSAESTDSVLNAWAAGVIADMKPTNSVANLSTSLIEIYREGLPKLIGSSLWKKKLEDINEKLAAGEFLNYEFTWKPLISDIVGTMHGIVNMTELITQFNRDSGRVVRRRREFEPEVSTEETVVHSNVFRPHLLSDTLDFYKPIASRPTCKVVRRRITTRRRWISCAFTYQSNLLSEDGKPPHGLDGVMAAAGQAKAVLGFELNPEVVYNLTPWSWAVDWISNLGDVIDNVTDYQQYGLVMPYGYAMEHTVVQDTYYQVGPSSLKSNQIGMPVRLTTEVKKRIRANPFGFGLTWSALNSTQQAILAALGITRRGQK